MRPGPVGIITAAICRYPCQARRGKELLGWTQRGEAAPAPETCPAGTNPYVVVGFQHKPQYKPLAAPFWAVLPMVFLFFFLISAF